jgi:hypothetical protein
VPDGRRLIGYVPIHEDDGDVTWYGPDDDLSQDVAARIGEHAFEGGEHPYPEARAAYLAVIQLLVDAGKPVDPAPAGD